MRVDYLFLFFFSSRRRHTRLQGDWSSDVCSSDLQRRRQVEAEAVDRLSAFFDIIQQDPIISQVKLIAEPWDVGEGGRSEERRVGKGCRSGGAWMCGERICERGRYVRGEEI